MSSVAVERAASPHMAAGLQSDEISSSRSRPTEDETEMEDIIGSSQVEVEPSTSAEKDPKKKSGFNLKKTAKNVVSGITRKKKGLSEEKSKSHDDLRLETGDQLPKDRVTPFNKMLNNLNNPHNKLNKMWSSLNKTFSSSSQNQAQFPELTGTRSTMTLGRFFGKKRDQVQDLPPVKEGRKAQTLGRMFSFAKIPTRKSREAQAPNQPETDP